jgi:autotransporter-associated beta strand protein
MHPTASRIAVGLALAALAAAPVAAQVVELNENFTSATATAGGWTLNSGFWPAQNNSDNPQPYSATGGAWGPGATLFTPAPGGNYFATDTTATGNTNGTVSDWLLTSVIALHNGDTIKFATRTRNPEEGPSRMEVRLSTSGSSTNVGTVASDVGAFTVLINSVNPSLTPNTYPTAWTTFTYTISGLSGTQSGRIAFHTFYANGGFNGPNGDTVGLATVTYTAVNPSLFTWTGNTSGSWNNTGNWSTATIPSSNSNNQLTFGTTPNPTMTNDIAGTLILNSMTFNSGSPVYSLSGNGLNFQTNSSNVLPQITQNSANAVTIGVPLTLTNNFSVNGTGNLTLSGPIGGNGSLTMSGTGSLTLSGAVAGAVGVTMAGPGTLNLSNVGNTYSGGTVIQNGTVQVAGDGALGAGSVTGSALGTLAFTGSTTTTRSFNMGNGTITVPAGQTVTFNGSPVSAVYLDGTGTFATNSANGASFSGVKSTASVSIVANSAADRFLHFDNSGALAVAAGVNSSGTSTTVNLSDFVNEGLGSLTLNASSQVNVANLQSFGTVNLLPGSGANPTQLVNLGNAPLAFNGGSRTFISIPANAGQFDAGMDLHGQNAVVAGGLFVNNGYVVDSVGAGTKTVIADYGSLVKGAGFYQNSVQTVNGGKFQSGNSPGTSSFGTFTFGPGGVTNYQWQINDPGPSPTFPSAPGIAGGTSSVTGSPDFGWSLIKAIKVGPSPGNFTWTATAASPLTVILQTLTGQTTVGNDVLGPMQNFDPDLSYTWQFVTWAGNYTGPTDSATLNSETIFDLASGPFANTLPPGARFTWNVRFNSGTSGPGELDLVFPVVPEPGTLALTGLAGLGLGWAARRRRR